MIGNFETIGNAIATTALKKYGNSSLYFDGTNDRLYDSVNKNAYAFGTGDFTVEFWCYPTASKKMLIIDARLTASAEPWIVLTNASMFIGFYTGATEFYATSGALVANIWQHIAITKQGSTFRFFKDGTQIYSGTNSDSLGTSLTMTIGNAKNDPVAGEAYTGYLNDVRITKGVARYTSNFTAPASPLLQF